MKKDIKFKIRCSAIGKIMSGGSGLTEIQEKKLRELSLKNRTEKQQIEYEKLLHKKENPELNKTVKTYCEDWLKEKLFGRRKEFSSKYTAKGTEVETESINFLVENDFIFFAEKNTERRENDFLEGECDIILPDKILDVKNSWGLFTFPLFAEENENTDYEWQLQGYMELFEREESELYYILTNTPEHLIDREIQYAFKDLEFFEESFYQKVEEQIRKNHIFDDIPAAHRVKVFKFKKDNKKIEQLKDRVSECQNYIDYLLTTI